MLINAGIREIIYEQGYPDDLAQSLLEQSDLELTKHK
jgi:deoxycytidylate deaminase